MSARARSQRIRPSKSWSGDNFLNKDPASITVKHRPADIVDQAFAVANRAFLHSQWQEPQRATPPHSPSSTLSRASIPSAHTR